MIVIVGAAHLREVIFYCSQLESGTSCHGTPFFFIFCLEAFHQEVGD